MWNPEIPYLLISGSWDYSIQIWDTRDGTCLDTVYDHGADVYGITQNIFYFCIKMNFKYLTTLLNSISARINVSS